MLCLSFLILHSRVLTPTHNTLTKNQDCIWIALTNRHPECMHNTGKHTSKGHNTGKHTSKGHNKAVDVHVNLTCKGGDHGLVLYTILSRAYWSTPPGTKQGRAFSPPSNTPAAAAPSLTCFTSALTQVEAHGVENKITVVADDPHITHDRSQSKYRCLDS